MKGKYTTTTQRAVKHVVDILGESYASMARKLSTPGNVVTVEEVQQCYKDEARFSPKTIKAFKHIYHIAIHDYSELK